MKNIKFIVLVFSTIIVISCEKEIELKESELASRIVLNSIFKANDTMWINLSESRSILFQNNGQSLPFINSATAELYENSSSVGKFEYTSNGNYFLPNFTPQSGVNYTIKINSEGFESIESSSIAPTPINIAAIDTINFSNTNDFDVIVNDNSNENNYYSIAVYAHSTHFYIDPDGEVIEDTYEYNEWICTKDINTVGINADETGSYCSQELLFSDENFNGQQHRFKLELYKNENVDYYIVYLRSISEDLFKYRSSVSKYENTVDNPFSQPVQVYSNVENGFGIFGGYSESKDSIIINP